VLAVLGSCRSSSGGSGVDSVSCSDKLLFSAYAALPHTERTLERGAVHFKGRKGHE
jgi:hypothetical protein